MVANPHERTQRSPVEICRQFQFLVKHIPGRNNTVADALSRIRNVATQEPAQWNLEYIRQQQGACTTISQLKSLLQSKSGKLKSADMKLKPFECELPNLFVRKDGVVCHHDKNGAIQIVVPRNLIGRVLEMMHNQLGHLGFKKTLQRTKDRWYFWSHMSLEIEDWCRKCEESQQRRNPIPKQRAPLQPISTSRAGELVTMDIGPF